jgi:molybdenum cofactor biosynthesis enzyme MoaA
MPQSTSGDFYCSEKFTWLSVDLEKRQTFSCCAARPAQIDITWIKQHPGQLFNTPVLQKEREQMLLNQPVVSCEEVCWKPEQANLISRRQMLKSQSRTHVNIDVVTPEKLNIVLGSTCNLTCSYCCKNYSSAWLRDIANHGAYLDQERFQINNKDRLVIQISQKEHQESNGFQILLTEIQSFSDVKEIYISGGEPFLYNNLPDLLNQLGSRSANITCYTGLGVDPTRFSAQLKKIKNKDRLTIAVSGETCNQLYEFNRYGNTWDNFLVNVRELQTQGFNYQFSSVLSNLTIFGLLDFVKLFADKEIKHQFCAVPDFLNVNVLDDVSKSKLKIALQESNLSFKQEVYNTISQPCTDQQRKELSIYVKEFARRRDLSLNIYPEHFLSWIEY